MSGGTRTYVAALPLHTPIHTLKLGLANGASTPHSRTTEVDTA